jgi:hypothetical protein
MFSYIVISSKDFFSFDLKKGKNYIAFNLTQPFYVKTLIELNPNIEAVSYRQGNGTYGYVNAFNGIGKNFIIENKEYEIIVNQDTNLVLPD